MSKTFTLILALGALLTLRAEERFATLATNKISYAVSGAGSNAVVLIHGWGGNKELWKGQVPRFERDYRVITIDLPGFGQSDKPKTTYSMAFLADGVNAVLQDAKVQKAVLAGFSMGTPVMCAFYKKYPAKVVALIAVDGGLRGFNIPRERLDQYLEPYRNGTHHEPARQFFTTMFPNPGTEKMRDEVIEVMLKTPAHVMLSSFEQMADGPSWEVAKIDVPLLVVNAQSPMWTDDYRAYVQKLQPKSVYKEIPGTGHFLQLEKPDDLNRIMLEFLPSVFAR